MGELSGFDSPAYNRTTSPGNLHDSTLNTEGTRVTRSLCRRSLVLAATLSLLFFARPGFAQWQPGYQAAGFVDGLAYCAIEFDGMFAIGGSFNGAGCVSSAGVVLTDFEQFYATGRGLWPSYVYPPGAVYALAVYQGSLIAAGEFQGGSGASFRNVARWTGEDWVLLGGSGGAGLLYGGPVFDLAVFEGDLIAVGQFTSSKFASSLQGVARYDGTQWQPMGVRPPGARALAVWNDELYCGLSKWNDDAWQPLGGFEPSFARVTALDVVDEGLAIGGSFREIDGETVDGTAIYDGLTIQQFGDGALTSYDPGFVPRQPEGVGGFASFEGETYLLAPIHQQYVGFYGLARLQPLGYRPGDTWTPVDGVTWENKMDYAGDLVAGSDRLVALMGSRWYLADTSSAGALDAIVLRDGEWSPPVPGLGWTSLPSKVTSKAQRNWLAIGDQGLVLQEGSNYRRVVGRPEILSLGPLPIGVFAAGYVNVGGHVPFEYPVLIEFDASGQKLGAFDNGMFDLPSPVNVNFSMAAPWNDGFLCVSTSASERDWDLQPDRFGFLSGTDALDLQPLPGIADLSNPVDDLIIHRGQPWYAAAGELVRIEGSLDGVMTASLVGTFNAAIHALASDGERLIVGGEFDSVNALHSPNLAIWDGQSWSRVPAPNGPVHALAVDEESVVYVGGRFTEFEELATRNLAVLRGQSIGVFADGPNGLVTDVAITDRGILVAGDFTQAGGQCAMHVAEWVGRGTTLSIGDTEHPEDAAAPPVAVQLRPPTPNPFNPRVTISFELARQGTASLRVLDPAGRLVRTLATESLGIGVHKFVWDGTDDQGIAVASGVYFAMLEADWRTYSRKMTLVR
jgi:FlgD Ig-like domain